jgi:hypothetical protein
MQDRASEHRRSQGFHCDRGAWQRGRVRPSRSRRDRFAYVNDTSPAALARYFELLREAGPGKRLAICASLTQAVRELAIAGIKAAHPDRQLGPEELREKLAERLYGVDVARRVFARHRLER